jgi:hypothetical protein
MYKHARNKISDSIKRWSYAVSDSKTLFMMNDNNITMQGKGNQDRHTFIFDSNVDLPDTVGRF